MSIPQSREELKDYCLRQLGWPVIEINIDLDQLDDRIDEAFQYYRQFHYDATHKSYLKHELTATDIANQYIEVPPYIMGITNVFPLGGGNTSRSMFDIRYQMRLQDVQSLTNLRLSNYYQTQQYLALIDFLLVGITPIRFNRHMDRVYIDWSWDKANPGEYLIFEVQEILDPDVYTKIYDDRMLKMYATALIKRQWGNNLKKFGNVQLPSGVFLNGQQIYDEAMAEIERLELEIRNTYELPPMFFVG